jgi:hypothetical protein
MIFMEKRERTPPVAIVVPLVARQPRSGNRELYTVSIEDVLFLMTA